MAIEKISLMDVPPAFRNGFTRAQEVIRNGSYDYGVALLKDIIKVHPGFWEARRALREAEQKKTQKMSPFARVIAWLSMGQFLMKSKALMKKNPREALNLAEEALAKYYAIQPLKMVALAAEELNAYFIAIDALEEIYEMKETDAVLNLLCRVHSKAGDANRVLQLRQQYVSRHPNDLNAISALRAAAATASMASTTFAEEEPPKTVSKSNVAGSNAPDMSDLEHGDRILRSEEDINEMIRRYEMNISAGFGTVETNRKVAELYQKVNRHQDAVDAYKRVVELQGVLDPVVDRAIEKSQSAIFETKMKQLQESGAPQEEIDAVNREMINYRLVRSEERVKKYPNDLQIRYELACLYWEIGDVTRALEEFQHSQRNPQRRLASMIYMGRCFHAMERYDMALEQFEAALRDMPVMDKDKMKALYYEGLTYDTMGKPEKALECYKQIYAVNLSYLDVADRINSYYDKKKHSPSA